MIKYAFKALKYLLLITLLITCIYGCTDYIKKEARGVKGSIDNAMMAVACVAIGTYPCVAMVVVKGYSEGVEAHDDKEIIKKATTKKDNEKKGWF